MLEGEAGDFVAVGGEELIHMMTPRSSVQRWSVTSEAKAHHLRGCYGTVEAVPLSETTTEIQPEPLRTDKSAD